MRLWACTPFPAYSSYFKLAPKKLSQSQYMSANIGQWLFLNIFSWTVGVYVNWGTRLKVE